MNKLPKRTFNGDRDPDEVARGLETELGKKLLGPGQEGYVNTSLNEETGKLSVEVFLFEEPA